MSFYLFFFNDTATTEIYTLSTRRSSDLPRRRAAGAIADCAADAVLHVNHFAFVRIEFDRRRATAGRQVVRGGAERRAWTILVIADEAHAALAGGERGHAVVRAGRRLTVGEPIARPTKAQVLEPFRQHQQRQTRGLIIGWEQRTVTCGVAAADAALVTLCVCTLNERGERNRGTGSDGCVLQK